MLFGSIATIFVQLFLDVHYEGTALFYGSLKEINLFGNRALTVPIFFLAFTQFFPAVTGIDAGVGMSGDLKNPKRSLVQGTFWAIGVTFVVYLITGFIFTLMNKEMLITGYVNNSATGNLLTVLLGFNRPFPCNIMGIIILGGILFATGSSALSCFMTALFFAIFS